VMDARVVIYLKADKAEDYLVIALPYDVPRDDPPRTKPSPSGSWTILI
jgi:hypothetical protein